MALICDTGALFALDDADDAHHADVRASVERERGDVFVPVVLLAEIDYMLTSRLSDAAARDFLESCDLGAFTLVPFVEADLRRCRALMRQYHDLRIGIADASVVATAERLVIPRRLTLDERHFRAIVPSGLGHFHILPADHESP